MKLKKKILKGFFSLVIIGTLSITSVIPVAAAEMTSYPLQSKSGYQTKYARAIQVMLYYYNSTTRATISNAGGIDGVFGNGTHNAVVQFQRNRGLSADGLVGVNSWRGFNNSLRYHMYAGVYGLYAGKGYTTVCMRRKLDLHEWSCTVGSNWYLVG